MHTMHTGSNLSLLAAAGLVLAAALPAAAATRAAAADASYRAEVAACKAGPKNQSVDDCLYEARSAQRDRRAGKRLSAGDDAQTLARNAAARCAVQPAADQADCLSRVNGGAQVEGSVEAGGTLQTLRRVEPAPSAASAPAPAAPR